MTLKNSLINKEAQAIVEYIVMFTVVIIVVLIVFGAFNPERLGIKESFNASIDGVITQINSEHPGGTG